MKFLVNYIATTFFYETLKNKENEICIEFQELRTLYRKLVRSELLKYTVEISSS